MLHVPSRNQDKIHSVTMMATRTENATEAALTLDYWRWLGDDAAKVFQMLGREPPTASVVDLPVLPSPE